MKVPFRSSLMRVYAASQAHRAVPVPAAMRLTTLRSERWARTHPDVLVDAHAQMRYLVGRHPGLDADALAKPYLFELKRREEMKWRPWIVTRMQLHASERIRRMRTQGTGVILHFLHHGQYDGLPASISRYGFQLTAPVASFFLSERRNDYDGRVIRRHLASFTANGVRYFDAKGAYPRMRRLLTEGELLVLASDLPGSLPMTFLNRPVLVSSGAARLSLETGAPIIPITVSQRGWRQHLTAEDPILPADFPDEGTLQEEIARRHEPAVLAWPEGMKTPLARWRPANAEDEKEFFRSGPRFGASAGGDVESIQERM